MPSTATNRLQGLTTSVAVKPPCITVATSNITLSGLQTISGVTVVEDDRVLVKGQSTGSENGIYNASTGSWTRAKDFDGDLDAVSGTRVLVRGTSIAVEYELTTADPIVVGTTALMFALRYGANATYDQTEAEIAESVTPTNYAYPSANALRYLSAEQGGYVIDGNATSQSASDVTAGLQDGLDVYLHAQYPAGTYKIDAALKVRPWTNIRGEGNSYFLDTFADPVIGTRIVQTAAAPCITTDYSGTLADARVGNVHLEDLALLGNIDGPTPVGTYGFYCTSSVDSKLTRVNAWFCLNAGFYYVGSLFANLHDCSAYFCQGIGLDMAFGTLAPAETSNSYMSNIQGGHFYQCGDAGIRLGDSTVKVNIRGCDFESNGNYYPGGLGYGVHITGLSRGASIEGCWFEDNKVHLVVGATTSVITVPLGTRIVGNEFWSTRLSGAKIVLNSGRDTLIESNHFFGANSKIILGMLTGCPILRGNFGDLVIEDQNGNLVAHNAAPVTNNFPDPVVSGWTLVNCTVAVEQIASPAGPVPVYKITPTGAGAVALQSANQVWSWAERFHTFGFHIKTDAVAAISAYHGIASVNMPKSYCSQDVDNYRITNDWTWQSIGRSITAADTGNQAFNINFIAVTTDPVYVTGMAAMPGIVMEPWLQPTVVISTLASSATPSVYGMTRCLTGGTTTITDLTNGALGQVLTIIAEHAITITDGTNLFLSGSANFVMAATDTLTLICKADGNWYEIGRSDNT